jgi:putative transposase
MPHRSHTELYYHFTWSTLDRRNHISESWENRLFDFIKNKCLELCSPLLEINGTKDHVHVLLRSSTNINPAKICHELKGASSHMINKAKLCKTHFGWQDGCGAFSVSAHDVDTVARYIRRQKRHHATGVIRAEWELTDSDNDVGME